MKFLDATGLAYFWAKTRTALAGKQDKLRGGAGQLIGIGDDGTAKATVYPSNENLLDNSCFIGGGSQRGEEHFPINQRGETEYPAFTCPDVAYCIDRWIYGKGLSGVSLGADGLTITKNDTLGYGLFAQRLDSGLCEYLANKTVTLSALVKGNGQISIGGMNMGTAKQFNIASAEYQLISNTYTFPSVTTTFSGIPHVDLGNNGDSITVAAMKLEAGSIQTLAHKEGDAWVLNDPPPNYALELEKCYRYLQPICTYHADVNHDDESIIGTLSKASRLVGVAWKYITEMRAKPTLLNLLNKRDTNSYGRILPLLPKGELMSPPINSTDRHCVEEIGMLGSTTLFTTLVFKMNDTAYPNLGNASILAEVDFLNTAGALLLSAEL